MASRVCQKGTIDIFYWLINYLIDRINGVVKDLVAFGSYDMILDGDYSLLGLILNMMVMHGLRWHILGPSRFLMNVLWRMHDSGLAILEAWLRPIDSWGGGRGLVYAVIHSWWSSIVSILSLRKMVFPGRRNVNFRKLLIFESVVAALWLSKSLTDVARLFVCSEHFITLLVLNEK